MHAALGSPDRASASDDGPASAMCAGWKRPVVAAVRRRIFPQCVHSQRGPTDLGANAGSTDLGANAGSMESQPLADFGTNAESLASNRLFIASAQAEQRNSFNHRIMQALPCEELFIASAQAEQHHSLNDRIMEALPCEEDMLVADAFASIREFLGQDASDGGMASKQWADLLKGAYPEWEDAPLDRSLACLVMRCRIRRSDPGSHRQVESIEYWAGAAHITLAMVDKASQECSRFDKQYTSAHDCLTPVGLRLWMEELCLSTERCLVWLATQCSSFVALCRAQSMVGR